MRNNIEMLIKSGISANKAATDTGLPVNTVYRIYSGETPISRVQFGTIEKLSKYWEKLDMITIEKRKNHEGIIGTEYTETYNDLEQAKIRLNEMISDALEGTDFDDLDEFEQDEYKQVEGLINGEYSLNQGDYTYYITITKGVDKVENIKKVIAGVENGEIELESLDPNYHEEEYIDAPNSIWIVHTVEGHEDLEVFFAEREEFAEVRQRIYNGEADESAFDELVYNEHEDRFDYDSVVAYRTDGGEINWI